MDPTVQAAAVLLALVVAIVFIGGGVAKLLDLRPMADLRSHLGLEQGLFRLVGGFEILGGVGVLVGLHRKLAVVGIMAALGLIGVTIGAGFYHQRAGEPLRASLPAVLAGSLAISYSIMRIAAA